MNLLKPHKRNTLLSIAIAAVLAVVGGWFVGGMNTNMHASQPETASANSTTDNLFGWAWSGYDDGSGNKIGVGWISFNCVNDPGCTKDYGVRVDETNRFPGGIGLMSGYAWSPNIGWISFNQSDLTGCPNGTCVAQMNWTSGGTGGTLSGWARALSGISGSGGWDGWISLSGSTYGLTLNSGGTFGTAPLSGSTDHYAWGGNTNVGWIDWAPPVPGGGVTFTPINPIPPAGSCGSAASGTAIPPASSNPSSPSFNSPKTTVNFCPPAQTPSGVGRSGVAPSAPDTWTWTCNYSGGAASGQCSAPITQCADKFDNNGNGLIDRNDPACHTDHDKLNNGTYDPSINSERTFNFKEF